MSEKTLIVCPECSAKLNVPDIKLGKKVRCPKCQGIFTAEVPGAAAAIEDFDEDPMEEPQVRRSPPSRLSKGGNKNSTKKSKNTKTPKQTSESNSTVLLLIGASVGLLVLLAAGLFFAGVFHKKQEPAPLVVAAPVEPPKVEEKTTPKPPPKPVVPQLTLVEKTLGLRWMSSETDLLIHVKIADLIQAPLLKGALNDVMLKQQIESIENRSDLKLDEIESVTVGLVDNVGQLMLGLSAGSAGFAGITAMTDFRPGSETSSTPPINPSKPRFLVVTKTKKAIDLKTVSLNISGAIMKEAHGKSYYQTPSDPISPEGGIWMPDSNTIIFGTTEELLASMERGETVSPRKEFASIDHQSHLVISMLVPDVESDTKYEPLKSQPWYAPLQEGLKTYAPKLVTLGVSVTGGFDLRVSMLSGTAEGANSAKATVESSLEMSRGLFNDYKKTVPELIAELGDMVLNNVKIEENEQVVKIATSIPESAQSKLEQLPPVIMMMAMMGRFGPPGSTSTGVSTMPMNADDAGPVSFQFEAPGESEAIQATTVEDLGEGLTLSAKTAWSMMSIPSPDGTTLRPIEIMIDVKGDGLGQICGSAGVNPKKILLEGGGALKKSQQFTMPDAIADSTFRAFDPSDHQASFEHPANTLRVKLMVDAPKNDATKIKTFEGSFSYLTAEESQELIIEDALKKANHPLTEPDFKAARIQLAGQESVGGSGPPHFELSCSKDYFIGQVKGTPGQVFSFPIVKQGQAKLRLQAMSENGRFADNFQINFVLHSKLKKHIVKFLFEGVPLPSPEKKNQTMEQSQIKMTPQTPSLPAKSPGMNPPAESPPANKPQSGQPSGSPLGGLGRFGKGK